MYEYTFHKVTKTSLDLHVMSPLSMLMEDSLLFSRHKNVLLPSCIRFRYFPEDCNEQILHSDTSVYMHKLENDY